MASRIVLLATSPRVAPGLLSWPAWQALSGAARVVTRDADAPALDHLRAAGIAVDVVGDVPDTALVRVLCDPRQSGAVVLLGAADGDPGLGDALAHELGRLAETGEVPEVEVLPGSWDVPGARLLDVVAVMDRLRSPGGCPWDAKQTHQSLVQYLVEETFETVETIETGDLVGLREELGDLLLQVVFHARIGEEHEQEPWSVDDVAAGIVEKLVRRHPHVFSNASAPTPDAVEANWERLKAEEKGRTSALEGVPLGMPGLTLAATLLRRAERAQVDVPVPGLSEGPHAPETAGPAEPSGATTVPDREEELGDFLLAVVAAANAKGLDAEAALRAAARRFAAAVRENEHARAGGVQTSTNG